MNLIEFLRARLDEDEEAAQRVRQPYRLYACDDGHLSEPIRINDLYGPHDGEYEQWSDGEDRLPNHRNSWALIYDPARALRDVEAKRRIIHQHGGSEGGIAHECPEGFMGSDEDDPHTGWLRDCLTLKLLALPYADHEEFREEWKP